MEKFKDILKEYLNDLKNYRSRNASEDSIRSLFLKFITDVFPSINTNEIDLEQFIRLSSHGSGAIIKHGFADAVYGDLVFEFKRELDENSRSTGESELLKYLTALDNPENRFGLLTDGENITVYSIVGDELNQLDEFRLDVEFSNDNYLRLDTYLFQSKNIKPTAHDIAMRLGTRSPVFWASRRKLLVWYSLLESEPSVQTKFIQWSNLLAVVYGSSIGDIELFIRHTYLVYLARILAFSTVEERIPSFSEVADILTGEAFTRLGFPDFAIEDFFAWITSSKIMGSVSEWLNGIAVLLGSSYDLSEINEDLLKALYQELVDPETRHDLGEFYTPDWLAELVLNEIGYPILDSEGIPLVTEDNSILDPACGSGTFLFKAIKLLHQNGLRGVDLIEFVQSHIAGLDVHPLAIVIAKANLILALGNDLLSARTEIRLPIYMANSLLIAESGQHPYIPHSASIEILSNLTGKQIPSRLPDVFHIPITNEGEQSYIDSAIDNLIEYSNPEIDLDTAIEGYKRLLARIIQDDEILDGHLGFWLSNLRLMRWLLKPPQTNRVWRFILKNATRPQMLSQRKFKFVVGNPPWLVYRDIQSRRYQRFIRNLIFKHGLLDKRSVHLFTQMEMATLFFGFSFKHYTLHNGVLAFVMTRSILTGAKQHKKFQDDYLKKANLILDFKSVEPIFNIPTCVVIINKDEAKYDATPIKIYTGKLQEKNLSLESASQILDIEEGLFEPPPIRKKSKYHSQVIQGATIVPRCFWVVSPSSQAKAINPKKPYLETDPTIHKYAHPPWKGITIRGSVESEFLYVTLLSRNLLPFTTREFNLVLLPLKKSNLLNHENALSEGCPGISQWIETSEKEWQDNRKGDFELIPYLDYQSKLTRQKPREGYRVLYNSSGTHLTSCIISISELLQEKIHGLTINGFIADSTTYWYQTKDIAEAFYLSAFLNAPLVNEMIKPYQTEGAFGAQTGGGQRDIHRRPFEVLNLPHFDSQNKYHIKLSTQGRQASLMANRWFNNLGENERISRSGRLRSRMRDEALKGILEEIDETLLLIFESTESISEEKSQSELF